MEILLVLLLGSLAGCSLCQNQDSCKTAVTEATKEVEAKLRTSREACQQMLQKKDEETQRKSASHQIEADKWSKEKSELMEAIEKHQAWANEIQTQLTAGNQKLSSKSAEVLRKTEELQLLHRDIAEKDALLKASLARTEQELAAKNVELQAKKEELQLLQRQLTQKAAKAVDLGVLLQAAKSNFMAVKEEVVLIFNEVKAGNMDRLQLNAKNTLDACWGASSSAYAFLSVKAEELTPEAAKAELRKLSRQAQEMWSKYVVEAEWAVPVRNKVSQANEELKYQLTLLLNRVPALSPYAKDPVIIQLGVYALFGLPVLLLIVLPLALTITTPRAEQVSTTTKSKKKKNAGKGGVAGRNNQKLQ